jgi:hypothetical protein
MGISPGFASRCRDGQAFRGLNAWQRTKFGPGVFEQNQSSVADPTFNLGAGANLDRDPFTYVVWNVTAGR